jgi:hypothetical protein
MATEGVEGSLVKRKNRVKSLPRLAAAAPNDSDEEIDHARVTTTAANATTTSPAARTKNMSVISYVSNDNEDNARGIQKSSVQPAMEKYAALKDNDSISLLDAVNSVVIKDIDDSFFND